MMPKRMGLVKCLISKKAQRQAARAGMLATPPHREGLFSLMTSFTKCPETSFTLPARLTRRGDERDGLEDDGHTGTAGAICDRGDAEAEFIWSLVHGL